MDNAAISVEVVYALADKQKVVRLQVPAGTTVRRAAELAAMAQYFPGLDVQACALGIFGKVVSKPDERVLEAGERVEIYRPLIADPKEVRKQRAARAAQAKAAPAAGQ